jgi:uncharacterized protein YdhG (YjbR/CyaY superfamily)
MAERLSGDLLNAKLQEIDDTPGFEVEFAGSGFNAWNEHGKKVRGSISADPEQNARTLASLINALRWPPGAPAEVKDRPFIGPPKNPAEKFEAQLAKFHRLREADPRVRPAQEAQVLRDLPQGITYYPAWITPAKAEEYLRTVGGVRDEQGRPVQRNLSEPTARRYANLMLGVDSPWMLSPDPLAFNKEGFLINGMHRCAATIICGLTMPFMVSEGWERQTFLALDKNLKRTSATSLLLEGEQFPGPMNAAASALIKAETQPDIALWKNKQVRPDEAAILHAVQTRPTLRECVAWARVGRPKWMNPAALAVARCLAAEACGTGPDENGVIHGDLEITAKFFDSFKGGGGLEDGDPALAVRRYLETSGGQGYIRRSELLDPSGFQVFAIVTAWNKMAMRERLDRLAYRADELKIPKPLRPWFAEPFGARHLVRNPVHFQEP